MTNASFDYNDWADKIFTYINGKMTPADSTEFEAQMAQIPELQDAVDFDIMLKKQAQEHFYQEYINANWDDIMGNAPSDNVDNKTKGKDAKDIKAAFNTAKYPLSIKGILGGLSVLILLVSVYFMYQNQAKKTKLSHIESLQDIWFAPISFETDNLNDTVKSLYRNGLYEQAELIFVETDTFINKNEPVGAYGLYRAINALTIKPPKTDLAFEILKTRYALGELSFKSEVTKWFLIKVYLQKKDYTKARLMLKEMTPEEIKKIPNAEQYSREILDLLKDL